MYPNGSVHVGAAVRRAGHGKPYMLSSPPPPTHTVAGSAVNAQNVDCSPSIGEYATLANFTILAELLDAAGLYGMVAHLPPMFS